MNASIRAFISKRLYDLNTMTKEQIWLFAFLLTAIAVTALLVGFSAAKRYNTGKWKIGLIFVGIAVAIAASVIFLFGCSMGVVKGTMLALILSYGSYCDIKCREVDDCLHLMIVISAFIGINITDIPLMLLSAIVISIPSILVCIICHGKTIGAADLKLTAGCAFLLGITRGIFGFVLGLTLGIIVNLFIQMKKDKGEAFPLVPYLAVGFMTAYLI